MVLFRGTPKATFFDCEKLPWKFPILSLKVDISGRLR